MQTGVWLTLPIKSLPPAPTPDPRYQFRNASGDVVPAGNGFLYFRTDARQSPICHSWHGETTARLVCREFGFYGNTIYNLTDSVISTSHRILNIHCQKDHKMLSRCGSSESISQYASECRQVRIICQDDQQNRDGFEIESRGLKQVFIEQPTWFICRD